MRTMLAVLAVLAAPAGVFAQGWEVLLDTKAEGSVWRSEGGTADCERDGRGHRQPEVVIRYNAALAEVELEVDAGIKRFYGSGPNISRHDTEGGVHPWSGHRFGHRPGRPYVDGYKERSGPLANSVWPPADDWTGREPWGEWTRDDYWTIGFEFEPIKQTQGWGRITVLLYCRIPPRATPVPALPLPALLLGGAALAAGACRRMKR